MIHVACEISTDRLLTKQELDQLVQLIGGWCSKYLENRSASDDSSRGNSGDLVCGVDPNALAF
jgi:hypothetical protein